MHRSILLLSALAIAFTTTAGSFDENAYRQANLATVIEGLPPREADVVYLDPSHAKYRTVVEYTGNSRPISDPVAQLVRYWMKVSSHPDSYAEMFALEVEVRQGNTTYWMPIQASLVDSWQNEMGDGDHAELMLLFLGANGSDAVFTIAGFEELVTQAE